LNFQIDSEKKVLLQNGKLVVEDNSWVQACAGFAFVKYNQRSLNAFEELEKLMHRKTDMYDQQALNEII
jgi:hypothetical protein